MSQRAWVRAIAKERLHAMHVQHVNKAMGMGLSHTKQQNMQRTFAGRKLLETIRNQNIPLWRRVTSGRLATDGYNAQMGIGKKRRYRMA